MPTRLRIGVISDTHGDYSPALLTDIDIMIHAGDLCDGQGDEDQFISVLKWLREVKAQYKIVIAGNHDGFIHDNPEKAKEWLGNAGIIYIKDESIEIYDLKIYGSPWTSQYYDMFFELADEKLQARWMAIPNDVDILITHSPPYGIQDKNRNQESRGCGLLAKRLSQIEPKIHVFGHIHEGRGYVKIGNSLYINAAVISYSQGQRSGYLNPFFIDLERQDDKWRVTGIF